MTGAIRTYRRQLCQSIDTLLGAPPWCWVRPTSLGGRCKPSPRLPGEAHVYACIRSAIMSYADSCAWRPPGSFRKDGRLWLDNGGACHG